MTPSPPSSLRRPTSATRPRADLLSSVQGTLALDLQQSWEPPLLCPVDDVEPPADRLVTPAGRAACVETVAHRFASALVEVLGGDRGPAQLLHWTTPEVYEQLQQRAALLSRTVPGDRRVRRLRSRVRSVRAYRPVPAVAELSIHLRRGDRSQAVAARLEHRVRRRRGQAGSTWVCVALEIG